MAGLSAKEPEFMKTHEQQDVGADGFRTHEVRER
jgi:hypothetical protein